MPSYRPTREMQRSARRAQKVRAEKPPSQRAMVNPGGGKSTGERRMEQLAARKPVSLSDVRVMVAWFARHLVDKQGSTWSEQGKGWQAWHGWGGDAGARWALSVLRSELPEEYDRLRKKAGVRKLIRHLNR